MAESLGMTNQEFAPDKLIAGSFPVVTESVTLESGQNLLRGALLGKVTATGKYKLSVASANDGSQNPVAILAKDTDATAGDTVTVVYLSGEFNEDAVIYGTGHTANSVRDALRNLNIYLKKIKS